MLLRRKPESGIWVVDYEVDGKRRRVSTGTRDHGEAKVRAKEILMGINVRPVNPGKPSGPVTVADLLRHTMLTEWAPHLVRSQATVRSNVKILEELVGDVPVSKVTSDTIQKLQSDMLVNGCAPGTVKRKLDALYKSLRIALSWDGGNGSGVPLLTMLPRRPTLVVDNKKDRVVSDAEFVEIIEAVRKRASVETVRDWTRYEYLLRFLMDTGCRLSEALGVDVANVEEIDGRHWVLFPIYSTKNKKARRIPLTGALADLLPAMVGRAVDGKLFPLKPATAWYMWDTIRQDVQRRGNVNIDDVTLHTFRHTCLTRLAKRLPLHKVSLWAGHSSIQITMDRYAHLQSEDFLACVEALDG